MQFYLSHDYDYVSNTISPTYPDGLDTEIFSFATLRKCIMNAKWSHEREHVTPYITNNPKKFKIFNYKNGKDLSKLRWTVDEKQDLQLVRKIYSLMRPKLIFSMQSILKIISKHPEIQEINKDSIRNHGHLKSLQRDKKVN